MIRLINLTKNYGKLTAVESLNLEVPGGQIFGFLGPNGAGKTTTIRMIMGVLKPTSGELFLGDYDMAREPEKAKAIAGFIPDRPFIYEKLSGGEFLEFIGKLHRLEPPGLAKTIAELLEHLELTPWKDELIDSYSHGMKQRLVVCAALLHDPKILVVDEPMVGMDPKGARTLKDLFRARAARGSAVFLSTHSLSMAEEVCHRIGIIHKGRLIACGSIDALHKQAQSHDGNLESVFLELTHGESVGSAHDSR